MRDKFFTSLLLISALAYSFIHVEIAHASTSSSISIGNSPTRTSTSTYLSNFSFDEGQYIQTHTTCPTTTYSVEVFRIGNYTNQDFKLESQISSQPCKSPLTLPGPYLPGLYVYKIIDEQGYVAYSSFVIRSKVFTKGVASIPFMTLLAYNKFNGSNTYKSPTGFKDRRKEIPFDTPIDYKSGLDKFFEYVFPVVREIEKNHLDISYVADFDINDNPKLLEGRSAFISMGHDEYWTDSERSTVINARTAGTNLLFFGANVAYWNVRIAERNNVRILEIYKSKTLDPNKSNPTIRFSMLGKPESQLTGLDYTCFPAHGHLEIKEPNSFVFAGTKAPSTEDLYKIVGTEVDQYKPQFNKFVGKVQVLARSKITCSHPLRDSHGYADFIYATSPSGAGTISIGSMGWTSVGLNAADSTAIGAFTRKVTSNILIASLRGPLGKIYSN